MLSLLRLFAPSKVVFVNYQRVSIRYNYHNSVFRILFWIQLIPLVAFVIILYRFFQILELVIILRNTTLLGFLQKNLESSLSDFSDLCHSFCNAKMLFAWHSFISLRCWLVVFPITSRGVNSFEQTSYGMEIRR